MQRLLSNGWYSEKVPDRETTGILDLIGIGNVSPFAGLQVLLSGDIWQCLAALDNVALGAIR